MDVIHQLRVGEPSTGIDLCVPHTDDLRSATSTGLDGIGTFLNPPTPDLISLVGLNEIQWDGETLGVPLLI